MPPAWTSLPFVSEAEDRADEPMGSKEKWWVELPLEGERPWLLKLSRLDARDGTVSGEDWAEWCVHHLAGLLGVPTAMILPATLDNRRAIVSRSVLHDRFEYLDHGNSVLAATFADYDQGVQGENPGYTPSAVRDALKKIDPPVESSWPPSFTGYDVWAGYLVMDGWAAARDRHQENWAVVVRGDQRRLAPSFDHGNALGFQERDERRQRMLSDEGHLKRWAARGISHHFAGQPVLTDLALTALQLASPGTAEYWMERLDAITDDAVRSIVSEVPTGIMSEVGHSFCVELLATNRRRLLDGYSSA